MQSLAQLEHEHAALDAAVTHFEALLQRPRLAHAGDLRAVLKRVIEQLSDHLQFEERAFYIPLQASGHARSSLVARLLLEHHDLRQTLEQLRPFLRHPRPSQDDAFLLYSSHLIDLYQEHSEKEHRWLFPLIEQLPVSDARPVNRLVGNRRNSCYSGGLERVACELCERTACVRADHNSGGSVDQGRGGHTPCR